MVTFGEDAPIIMMFTKRDQLGDSLKGLWDLTRRDYGGFLRGRGCLGEIMIRVPTWFEGYCMVRSLFEDPSTSASQHRSLFLVLFRPFDDEKLLPKLI